MNQEQQALQHMRNAIRSSPRGEQVLARMEKNIDSLIKSCASEVGQVYLCLLAATIAVRMSDGTIK